MHTSYFRPSDNVLNSFQTGNPRPFSDAYYDTPDFRLAKKGWWLRGHGWEDVTKTEWRQEWTLWIGDQLAYDTEEDIEVRLAAENLPPIPRVSEKVMQMIVISFVDGHRLQITDGLWVDAIQIGDSRVLIGESYGPIFTASTALPPIVEIIYRRYSRGLINVELYDMLLPRYPVTLSGPLIEMPYLDVDDSSYDSD